MACDAYARALRSRTRHSCRTRQNEVTCSEMAVVLSSRLHAVRCGLHAIPDTGMGRHAARCPVLIWAHCYA
eukprot:726033-Rhodomonas_salina.2